MRVFRGEGGEGEVSKVPWRWVVVEKLGESVREEEGDLRWGC